MSEKDDVLLKPKRDPRDLVLAALIGVVIAPFTSIVQALAVRLMWTWFLAPQYGDGPTLRAWFGVIVVFDLFTISLTTSIQRTRSTPLPKNIIVHIIESSITHLFLFGIVIATAAISRDLWGWSP